MSSGNFNLGSNRSFWLYLIELESGFLPDPVHFLHSLAFRFFVCILLWLDCQRPLYLREGD